MLFSNSLFSKSEDDLINNYIRGSYQEKIIFAQKGETRKPA